MSKKPVSKKEAKSSKSPDTSVAQQNAQQTLQRKEARKRQSAKHSGPAAWTRRQ